MSRKKKKKKRVTGVPKRTKKPDHVFPMKLDIPDDIIEELGPDRELGVHLVREKGELRMKPNPEDEDIWEKLLRHKDFDVSSLVVDESQITLVDKVTGEPIKASPGRAAVDSCMFLMSWLRKNSQTEMRHVNHDKEWFDLLAHWRALWATMQLARVIEFPLSSWWRLEEQLEATLWTPFVKQEGEDAFHSYLQTFYRRPECVPPEKVPFNVMWIGIERGVDMKRHDSTWLKRIYQEKVFHDVEDDIILLGYHVQYNSPDKYDERSASFIIQELYYIEKNGKVAIIPKVFIYNFAEKRWNITEDGPGMLIVQMIIDIINDHKRFIVEKGKGKKSQKALRKASKKAGSIGYVPAPYYVVRLKDELVEDIARDEHGSRPRFLSHRYDRRGHERCYVRRGPLPLDPELYAKLQKAGYKIFTTADPDAETYRRLMRRQMKPKSHDEWLAILTKWIEATVCGDESLPYVPAVRVPTKLAG
jgi:hypothetical protein